MEIEIIKVTQETLQEWLVYLIQLKSEDTLLPEAEGESVAN